MKERLAVVETRVGKLENENELNRKFKHETNGHIHSHTGEISAIKSYYKEIVDELVKFRKEHAEGMVKITELINWKLSIKYMLMGGAAMAGMGATICTAAYFIIKMYLDYKK